MHPLDRVLQNTTPTVMVPLHGRLAPMQEPGHRFLAAQNGLWLEVLRAWCHIIWPLSTQTIVAMPYGSLEKYMQLVFQKIPQELIALFIEDARKTAPVETAAWITWDQNTNLMAYQRLEPLSADRNEIKFNRPALPEGVHLVVDLHSHGDAPAFFSPKDNKDDRGEVKIAGVVGNCREQTVSMEWRFCINGLFVPLTGPSMKNQEDVCCTN